MKIKGLRWCVVSLVAIATVIKYIITAESYVPFFLLGAALVPLAILSVWLVGGRIHPVKQREQLIPAEV